MLSLAATAPAKLMASDDQNLYHYDGAAIWYVSLELFGAPALLTNVSLPVLDLAVDTKLDGWVYWSQQDDADTGSVMRIPKPPQLGTSPAPFIGKIPQPHALLADDTGAYWVSYGVGGCDVKASQIMRLREAQTGALPEQIATSISCPVIAQDARNVYWAAGGNVFAKGKGP
ncbi:hypothetical protein A7982_13585 [Minicystis rosea]|nr:hypothetical protein A7982_13585 [Minicystis rosea]